ncbi:hypothetical protein Tco_0869617 [Tanacetum coccineum]
MQMMYCFVNNIHVDYAELLWEGLYYSLHHPTPSIPYPSFTKIIISHYLTSFPEISRRARDKYHNLKDDDIMKNIFNSGRYKDKVGMKISYWMISDEMKHAEHYQMTPSAPRSPNPKMDTVESSAPKRSTMICFYLPERRPTRLTPPAPVPTVDKADEMILQDTLQANTKRANECIVSITEPDYKNLNKNDTEDMYLLIMNGKVPDYAEIGLLWSLSVFIRSSVIWEIELKNIKCSPSSMSSCPAWNQIQDIKERRKRVMRHSEIHKFCDATLNRVLEGLRSYNNDVKYGYIQRDLTNEDVEYLKLFEEEIEVRLKYQNHMRRWEMYVNGIPLGPQRERLE